MSVLGTGIAAGVAQTSLQSQQVARERDRKKAQDDESAKRVQEQFDAHLHALEDVNKVESVDRLQVDGHLSQDQPGGQEPPADQADESRLEESGDTGSLPPGVPTSASDDRLYHHLDVKG